MYAFIHGRLDQKKSDGVVVEAGGVGYMISTAASTLSRLPAADADVKLYTRFIVREDAHTLYGFLTREELGMFETLLSVSGVGPKAALALLSAVTPSKFGLAVLTEDYKLLTRAQGVGPKLAQKIVFELRDKMKKELTGAGGRASGAAGADAPGGEAAFAGIYGGVEYEDHGKFGEAVEALIVLGCSASEANAVVSRVYKDELSIEDIIRGALAEFGR